MLVPDLIWETLMFHSQSICPLFHRYWVRYHRRIVETTMIPVDHSSVRDLPYGPFVFRSIYEGDKLVELHSVRNGKPLRIHRFQDDLVFVSYFDGDSLDSLMLERIYRGDEILEFTLYGTDGKILDHRQYN
ncbi:MAG: hypothetical protein ACYCQJ_13775 [Nitrososphaerales archaeon]